MTKKLCLILFSVSLILSCSKQKKPEKAPEMKEDVKVETKAKQDLLKAHWSYDGAMGPTFWGDLDVKFVTCKEGRSQSPIDLIWKRPTEAGSIEFKYGESLGEIVDNGHSIQVNVAPGNMLKLRGEIYELMQLQIHSPSEHTISGKNYEMEIHFVHKNQIGNIAIVGVLVSEGAKNDVADILLSNIPKEKHSILPIAQGPFNPGALLPDKMHFYHYMGSLTVPPCTEGVNWNVFNTSIEFSKGQIAVFRSHYLGNSRPTQPLNDRQTVNY